MEIIGYVALIAIGVVLGLMGAGGSILAIPVLVYFFSMEMETASAYSLFLVGVTSLAGSILKQRQRSVPMASVLLFAIPSILAAFIARKFLIILIPEKLLLSHRLCVTKNNLLLTLFCVLLFASAFSMLLRTQSQDRVQTHQRSLRLIPIGFVTGLTCGLAGAGGGFLILPSLILFGRLSFSAATATSLLIIASNALVGFCGDLMNRAIDWHLILLFSFLAFLGLFLGHWSEKKFKMEVFSARTFGWITLLVGISILVRELIW